MPNILRKKLTIFITNIKSTHSFYIFTKIWHLEIFDNETTAFFLKMKKLCYLASNFDKCGMEKKFEFYEFVKYGQRYFDSERLWYSKLSLLKLRAVELAILDLKSLWKSMKLWELLISVMKTGGFFIDLWQKQLEIVKLNKWKIEN